MTSEEVCFMCGERFDAHDKEAIANCLRALVLMVNLDAREQKAHEDGDES